MSVTVAPIAGFTTGQRIRHISDGVVDDTVVAIHIHKKFIARIGVGHVGGVGDTATCVHTILAYALRPFLTGSATLAMNHHVVGATQQHLGLAVAIPVVGDDVELVAASADHIGTGIYPPEQRTIHLVGVDAVVGSIAAADIVGGIVHRAAALDDDFHLAVAIEVGDLTVIGDVGVGDVFATVVINLGKWNVKISGLTGGVQLVLIPGPYVHRFALALLHPAHHCAHRIGARGCALAIGEVGNGQRGIVESGSVAIHIVLRVVVLFSEYSPTEIHSGFHFRSHQSASQLVGGALGMNHCESKY